MPRIFFLLMAVMSTAAAVAALSAATTSAVLVAAPKHQASCGCLRPPDARFLIGNRQP